MSETLHLSVPFMEKHRLCESMRDVHRELHTNRKDRSWGTYLCKSLWYIVSVMLILTVLIGLVILSIRLMREGHIETHRERNANDPVRLLQGDNVGREPPTQLDHERFSGRGYVVPFRNPILYVAREENHRTPTGINGSLEDAPSRQKRFPPLIVALIAYGTVSGLVGAGAGAGIAEAIHASADAKVETHSEAIRRIYLKRIAELEKRVSGGSDDDEDSDEDESSGDEEDGPVWVPVLEEQNMDDEPVWTIVNLPDDDEEDYSGESGSGDDGSGSGEEGIFRVRRSIETGKGIIHAQREVTTKDGNKTVSDFILTPMEDDRLLLSQEGSLWKPIVDDGVRMYDLSDESDDRQRRSILTALLMGGIVLPIVKPIIDSQVRMYELNEERFNGKSVTDDDLKPVVEQGDQDANYTIVEVGREKRSIITDLVGDGKNLMTSAGFLKDFA